jgi:hypothetical protein
VTSADPPNDSGGKPKRSAEEIARLKERFDRDPNSLSVDEVRALYEATRSKIREFEARARRKAGSNDDTNGPT